MPDTFAHVCFVGGLEGRLREGRGLEAPSLGRGHGGRDEGRQEGTKEPRQLGEQEARKEAGQEGRPEHETLKRGRQGGKA